MLHVGMTFGQSIIQYRLDRNWSQATLARRAGIARPNLSDMERDKRDVSLSTIRILAATLGVSPSQLLEGPAQTPAFSSRNWTRKRLEHITWSVVRGTSAGQDAFLARQLKRMAWFKLRAIGLPRQGRRPRHRWGQRRGVGRGRLDRVLRPEAEHHARTLLERITEKARYVSRELQAN